MTPPTELERLRAEVEKARSVLKTNLRVEQALRADAETWKQSVLNHQAIIEQRDAENERHREDHNRIASNLLAQIEDEHKRAEAWKAAAEGAMLALLPYDSYPSNGPCERSAHAAVWDAVKAARQLEEPSEP